MKNKSLSKNIIIVFLTIIISTSLNIVCFSQSVTASTISSWKTGDVQYANITHNDTWFDDSEIESLAYNSTFKAKFQMNSNGDFSTAYPTDYKCTLGAGSIKYISSARIIREDSMYKARVTFCCGTDDYEYLATVVFY